MDLRGKPCLVVGGGAVAVRKVSALVRAGAAVHVVALALEPELEQLAASGRITCRIGCYAPSDLDTSHLVIAATDERGVNVEVSRAATERRIPVNVVDAPALCSFIMPAIVDRSPVLVAVSSSGTTPVLARLLRAKIESVLPARFDELAQLCESLRADVKAALPSVDARRLFWEEVLEGAAAELCLHGDRVGAERQMREALHVHGNVGRARSGDIALVGVGPGDPDLVAFRALRFMQRAELVVHGVGVPHAVLDLCRRDAHRIVSPSSRDLGYASHVERCVERAAAGERVCVLELGDAFRSAAGQAWLLACASAALSCQVVPGITPLAAGD
jgi:uroporphyrin-III C-methyltransferase/precorrin-2 dehydrogenase/sirohydrochlorin ferrochelatase